MGELGLGLPRNGKGPGQADQQRAGSRGVKANSGLHDRGEAENK